MEQKDYFVRHPKQIVSKLSDIHKHHCSLLVSFDNEQSFLTAILEIDGKGNVFKFDCSRNDAANKQLLSSSKVLFRTEYNGIKVSFKGVKIKQSGDKASFSMPIPDVIYWMQRRDCYRIRVPTNHYCGLQLMLRPVEGNAAMETVPKRYRLLDVSVDGFAFLNADNDIQWHFESNIENLLDKEINGKLMLREYEDIQSDIRFVIRNVEKMRAAGHYRVGCQFIDITPLLQSNLQGYMQKVELESKEKAERLLVYFILPMSGLAFCGFRKCLRCCCNCKKMLRNKGLMPLRQRHKRLCHYF